MNEIQRKKIANKCNSYVKELFFIMNKYVDQSLRGKSASSVDKW